MERISVMKLMIASDIHGSAHYCRKLVEQFHQEKPDRLILLGDLLYHGPRNDLPREYNPKAVIPMLNQIKESLICIRGNCDTEVDQMVLEFPILSETCLLYWNGRMIYASHGHHVNPEKPPFLRPGDILLNGHTHVPKWERMGENWYLNPGSVAIPKEKSHHSYVILGEDEVIFKTMGGEIYRGERMEPVPAGNS